MCKSDFNAKLNALLYFYLQNCGMRFTQRFDPFFGTPDKCTEANNIISELDGSVSFELLKKAAKENNARTSKRWRDLAEIGKHPWQQPEFISAHSKRTIKRMRELVAREEHLFQQPEFIEENRK